jgi:hypothetical protein
VADGSVVRGPATRALTPKTATLNGTTITVSWTNGVVRGGDRLAAWPARHRVSAPPPGRSPRRRACTGSATQPTAA